ncbi:MAG TPA: hypothetical protein VGF91_01805 [Solirubrobacteraceae bacterium]|jgi:hypothetical protein
MEIAKGFRGSGRYTGVVRAARAYLAGFGTTGSLLAGAALMFIVASALVAFRGWPHLAVQPAPGEVVISPRSARSTGPSASARRLAAVVAAPVGGTGTAAAPGARRRGGTGAPAAGRRGGNGTVGTPVRTSIPVATQAGTPASPCATSGCGTPTTTAAPPPSPLQQGQQVIQQVTNTLGHAVTGTGQQVGSVVQQTTSSVAGAVGGSSSPVGGAVQQTGSGAAKTVTGVTNALGGLVSGLGGGLPGR